MKSQYRHLLFLIMASIGVSYFTYMTYKAGKNLEKTSDWIDHTHRVINNISAISTTISEIQSDFRGWQLVDKQIFASEIKKRTAVLRDQLKDIKILTADNAFQQQNIHHVTTLANELLDWQDAFMLSHKASSTNISPGLRGKLLMDSIKQKLALMSTDEELLMKQRIISNQRISYSQLNITIASGVCYIAFVVFVIIRLQRNAARRSISEASLLSSEIKYRRLIEDAGVVMFTTDIQGDFSFVNNRIEPLTGYKNTEVVNKNFTFLVAPEHIDHLKDHYQNQYVNRIAEACIEFPIITKSGEEKWIEQDSVLVYENDKIVGFQCIAKDIHQRKTTETALKKIEDERKEYDYRLQSILDNTPLMVFIKDLDGRYILVNKRFKETFSNQPSVIGKTDYDIDTPENADRYREADRKVIETLQPMESEETINDHGRIQNIMIVKFPLLDKSGRVFAISGIASDVTERVQYHKHLVETRKKAETAEKLQGEFLANMSHEIRTPMNGIVGMTNLLLQTPLNAEQESFLQIVRQSSDNLLFLINDILDLSKIKAGKMTIESIEFNIANVMETVIAPFRIKMKEKGVDLITNIHSDIPELVMGDPYRLSQILSNLFSNALKFTQKGHIKFTVEMSHENEDCTLQFCVEDSGIGISPEQIDHIFESFAQASMDTTRKFGGTGLGLSITKQLIQLQNGSLKVTSTVDKGSTFCFTIPYKRVRQEDTRLENEKQAVDKEALKGKRVLIVEDNQINQMVISFTLKQAGISATIVGNGREAVELLETGGEANFDLIIMDLQMPEMDGFEASLHIRRQLKIEIPIIAMTASVLRDERIKCLEVGMNDYMSKPFKQDELFLTMNRLLNESPKKELAEITPTNGSTPAMPYDFDELYKMMPRSQASEVLGLFVDNTPVLLNKLQTAVLSESWSEVSAIAQILKSNIELLKLQEMMYDIADLERMARLNIQTEMMPYKVSRLIDYFNSIKPSLEQEKNQMAVV